MTQATHHPAERVIIVQRDVQQPARLVADVFRQAMRSRGTFVVNLLSSPGAGKTTLLQATAQHWRTEEARSDDRRYRMAVLVGDIATDRDAQRLAPYATVAQLTTGGACHLDLSLVQRGWDAMQQPACEFLFLENVGNLVCPAAHDLGEHLRVILLSTTEGDDKPAKYPKAFRTSQGMVISKTDLLPHVPFSCDAAVADARRLQPDLAVFPVSALQPTGIAAWCQYLVDQRTKFLNGHTINST